MKVIVLLLLVAIQLHISSAEYQPEDIFTYAADFDAARRQAQEERKPIMVFYHLRTCPACKNLLNDLRKHWNQPTVALSEKFVIVDSLGGSPQQLANLGPKNHNYYPSNTTATLNTNVQRPAAQPAQQQKFVIVTQRPATPQPTTPTTVLPPSLSGAIKYPNPTAINTINLPQNIQVQKVQQNPKIVIVNPPSSQQQAQQGSIVTPTGNTRPIFVGQDVAPPELDDLSHLA